MAKNKKENLGNYICKIGKYDVRQHMVLPRKQKNFQGKVTMTAGSTEGRVYLGKKLIVGKLSGAYQAIEKAYGLLCESNETTCVSKRVIKKYKLAC